MKENLLDKKSYDKAKRAHTLFRREMFEKNRKCNMLTYLDYYDSMTRDILLKSIKEPIPDPLPPPSLLTISYYRRECKPAFMTRLTPDALDPHLTYESLWILAGIEDEDEFPNYQQVVKEFQEELPLYLQSSYPQIKEIAIIAAGNKIIGKVEDIINIVREDQSYLWVMVNHIYDRKIVNPSVLNGFLIKGVPIAFRTIFQLTNNYKDEIIESILKDQTTLKIIVESLNNPNEEIEALAIRIIGNILAQPDDYSHDLSKYNLLKNIYPLLSSKNLEIRKDSCWLIANYVYDSGAAKQLLFAPKLMERIISMLYSEQSVNIKIQIYFIFSHLVEYGDKKTVFEIAVKDSLLERCEVDLGIQNQQLTLVVLNLILRLVTLGDEYSNQDQQGEYNIFARQIQYSDLRKFIKRKSYDKNQEISNLSCDIADLIRNNDDDFDM